MIKVILEIKGRKVYKDPLGLLDLPDLLDLQELTQQYLDPLGRKVKQGHKVFKEYRVSKVRLDPLDHKEILETKVHKVRLDLLDYKEYKVHKELLVEMVRKV